MSASNLLSLLTKQPAKGAIHTSTEILQQPLVWQKLWSTVIKQQESIKEFLASALSASDQIIFTGAGTSAYIGLSLHGLYFRKTGLLSQAVATTDIVSHPTDYFDKEHHPFMVSFARSGNSPESIAALQLADQHTPSCHHLIITCDPDGALAGFKSANKVYVFVLPTEANDQGLAMTSSYSTMLLTGILFAHLDNMQAAKQQIEQLTQSTQLLFEKQTSQLHALAGTTYGRAVFLGSGPLLGTATEAQLKLQELTDGKIICKADSYLGFRHGPKAVLNERTLIVFFLSALQRVRRYELDLIQTILEELEREKEGEKADNAQKKKNDTPPQKQMLQGLIIAPCKEALEEIKIRSGSIDRFACVAQNGRILPDYQPVGAIVPGQVLALFASLHHGTSPDSPSSSGAISRVVQGVRIYPDAQPEKVLDVTVTAETNTRPETAVKNITNTNTNRNTNTKANTNEKVQVDKNAPADKKAPQRKS